MTNDRIRPIRAKMAPAAHAQTYPLSEVSSTTVEDIPRGIQPTVNCVMITEASTGLLGSGGDGNTEDGYQVDNSLRRQKLEGL